MKKAHEDILYWMLLNHRQWTMYIAATSKGLCYVSSQHAPFDELKKWANKRLPSYILYEDECALEPYTIELIDYLEGRCKEFTLPTDLHGTAFQQAVWNALQEVPYGKTVSYTDIATRLKKSKAVRAVGTAIGANPVLIRVPCHRVIGKSGKLSGYKGGLEMKEKLLRLEEKQEHNECK